MKLYVINLKIISNGSKAARINSYKVLYQGKNELINNALLWDLEKIISNVKYSDTISNNSDTSISMIFNLDFEKIVNLDLLISKINNKVIDIFGSSFAISADIPDKPNYKLKLNKSDNSSGWSTLWHIDPLDEELSDTEDISTTITQPQTGIDGESISGKSETNEESKKVVTSGISVVFENTYYPETISFELTNNPELDKDTLLSTGYLPFIWYNSYQIEYEDIEYFQLSHSGIIPVIKIIFYDSLSIMSDKGMPLDDTKIKVYLNPRNENLKPIYLEFKIGKFSIVENQYTITGLLNINDLYISKIQSYSNISSYNLLQKLSREMGLGFNSNIIDTNDTMTWINTNDTSLSFIEDIIKCSYISDNSYLIGYIDYYYHFNYIDLEKEINRDIMNEMGISSFGLEEAVKVENNEIVSKLFLTTDPTMEATNNFIEDYKIINNSTNVSISYGYKTRLRYYNESSKEVLSFDLESQTTNTGDKIILKGTPGDDYFFSNNINLEYVGKIDVDNSHKNYNYSSIQNEINLAELTKIGLSVTLPTPNYNLYKCQKVNLLVVTPAPTPVNDMINSRLSGEWLISEIKFEVIDSYIKQKLLLIRRDLGLTQDEIDQGVPEIFNSRSSGSNNNNPYESNPNELTNTDVYGSSTPASIYNVTGDKNTRVEYIIKRMRQKGVTNKFTQAAILSVIDKECGFELKPERTYSTTNSSRIKEIFAAFKRYKESEIDIIKKDEKQFFDIVYGGKYGNGSNEGYKYRGRGFNQLTFRGNYEAIGKEINKDIINNPDLILTDLEIATDAMIAFFKRNFKKIPHREKKIYHTSEDINDFNSLNDATGAIYHCNAGWGKSYNDIISDSTGGRKKTFDKVHGFYTKVNSV